MAKEILPHKLVVHYDEKCEVKDAVLIYKIREDGAVKNVFYTMSVKPSISGIPMNTLLTSAKESAETCEKISVVSEVGVIKGG